MNTIPLPVATLGKKAPRPLAPCPKCLTGPGRKGSEPYNFTNFLTVTPAPLVTLSK